MEIGSIMALVAIEAADSTRIRSMVADSTRIKALVEDSTNRQAFKIFASKLTFQISQAISISKPSWIGLLKLKGSSKLRGLQKRRR